MFLFAKLRKKSENERKIPKFFKQTFTFCYVYAYIIYIRDPIACVVGLPSVHSTAHLLGNLDSVVPCSRPSLHTSWR